MNFVEEIPRYILMYLFNLFREFSPKISDLLIDLLLEPAANYLHLKPRLRAATMANWFHQTPITSNAGSQSIIFLN